MNAIFRLLYILLTSALTKGLVGQALFSAVGLFWYQSPQR